MILSTPELREYIRTNKIRFNPSVDSNDIDQVSINLRLGREFTTFKKLPDHIPAISIRKSLFDPESAPDLWDTSDCDTYKLKPGHLVLAKTLEKVSMPNDLMGFVEGRSSWARLGITIHLTAPKIDPGFEGTITLEMRNLGNATVELAAESDKPAQLILMRITSPLKENEIYGTGEDDIFQYQSSPIPKKE